MQRFFFAGYRCENNIKSAAGNITMSCDAFPPNLLLRQKAHEMCMKAGFPFGLDDVVITSLYEFKDKTDFDSFQDQDFEANDLQV